MTLSEASSDAEQSAAALDAARKFMQNMVPPMQAAEMPLASAIFCHIFILNSVLERASNRVAEAHGLTLPQWMALGCIGHGGEQGVTHSELGQRLMLSKAPITGMVDRLKRAEYVQRLANEKDRRVSHIKITPKGQDVWNRVRSELREHATQHCNALPESEQGALLSMLSCLLNSVASSDPTLAASYESEINCAGNSGLATRFLTPCSIKVADEVGNAAKSQTKRKSSRTMNEPVMNDSAMNDSATSGNKEKEIPTAIQTAVRALIVSAALLSARGPLHAQDAVAPVPSAPSQSTLNAPTVSVPTNVPSSADAPRTPTEANANAALNNAAQAAQSTLNQTAVAGPEAPNNASGLGDQRLAEGAQAQPLSVIEAIALALANSPQRKAALAGLDAARARIGTARSAGGPQVNLRGNATYIRPYGASGGGGGGGGGVVDPNNPNNPNPDPNNPGNVGGGAGGARQNQQLGLDASIPIYTGGRVKASTRVAAANAEAQAAQVLQLDQELVLNVALGYLGILRSENLLDVANSNLAVSRERLRVAQVRYDAGAAARLEVLRARTTLDDASQRRTIAVNSVAQTKAGLNTLLGRAPETPLRVEAITSALPSTMQGSGNIENAPPVAGAGAQTPTAGQGATTGIGAVPSTSTTAPSTTTTSPNAPNVTAPGNVLPGSISGGNTATTAPGTATNNTATNNTLPGIGNAGNPNQGAIPNAGTTTTTTPGSTGSGVTAPGVSVPGVTAPGASGAAGVGTGAGAASSGTVLTQPSGSSGSTIEGGSAANNAAQANLAAAARLAGEVNSLSGQGTEALRTAAGTSRQSLAVLEAQLRAAEASVDVAKSQKKPGLDFSISGFLRNPATTLGRFALTLGLGLAQNIVDSGRTRSQVREARSIVEQLRQQITNQKLQVANQIEQALLGLDAAQQRVNSADSAVVSAAEALRAAQIGYAAGSITNLEVSDAQTALLAAQTDAVNARFDVAQSQAQLAAAVGTLNPIVREQYDRALNEATQNMDLEPEAAAEAPRKRRKFLGIF